MSSSDPEIIKKVGKFINAIICTLQRVECVHMCLYYAVTSLYMCIFVQSIKIKIIQEKKSKNVDNTTNVVKCSPTTCILVVLYFNCGQGLRP